MSIPHLLKIDVPLFTHGFSTITTLEAKILVHHLLIRFSIENPRRRKRRRKRKQKRRPT
jgi:hypothetical protein